MPTRSTAPADPQIGRGKRYFGAFDAQQLLEDPDVVVQGRRVLHLLYRVRR
jgi:hypothetical protein